MLIFDRHGTGKVFSLDVIVEVPALLCRALLALVMEYGHGIAQCPVAGVYLAVAARILIHKLKAVSNHPSEVIGILGCPYGAWVVTEASTLGAVDPCAEPTLIKLMDLTPTPMPIRQDD